MPKYSYIGSTIDGQEAKGVLSAKDISELEIKLANKGILQPQTRLAFSTFNQLLVKHLKGHEITRSTRQLAILLKSKVSLIESLFLVKEQVKDKSMQVILANVIKQVESGKSLAESLKEFPVVFDELYASMVEAGEISGTLEFSFDKLAEYREKSESLSRKVKSALAYPILVVAVAIAVVIALILYVVPVFSTMYENFGAQLPPLTRSVVATSEFIKHTFIYWIFGILASFILVALLFYSNRYRITLDKIVINFPYVGRLFTKLISARFSRTLGSLLNSGVDIIFALEVSGRSTGNQYVRNVLGESVLSLVAGKSLASVLEETRLFPKTLLRMTSSGEKTGQLGQMLTNAADFFESETNSELATLATLIEPIIIIMLGAFIAFILVAMYLPLFELVGSI